MGGNDILMKTLVRNSELMKRYDITPFQMSEWRQKGIAGRGFSYEEDIVAALGRKAKVVDPCAKPVKFIDPPPSAFIHEAAKMLGVSTAKIREMKGSGQLAGGHGVVTIASIEAYMKRENAFMTTKEAAAMCGVSSETIRRWVRNRLIKGVKGRVLIDQVFPERDEWGGTSRRKRVSGEGRVRFSGPRVGSRDYLGGTAYDY